MADTPLPTTGGGDTAVASSRADRALQRAMARAVARSWRDDAFRQQLLDDPRSVLESLGAKVPEGTRIELVEPGSVVLPLPLPPETGASPEDLERAVRVASERAAAALSA